MLRDANAKVERLADTPEFSDADKEALESLGRQIAEHQMNLDRLRLQRRQTMNDLDTLRAEASELDTTIVRYNDLEDIFRSDIRRLEAIEEGGFLLRRFDDQPCPLCGAEPSHQHTSHEPEDLERQHQADVIEMAKIDRDSRDLRELIISLSARLDGLRAREERLNAALAQTDVGIRHNSPKEASLRQQYLATLSREDGWRFRENAVAQRDALQRQLDEVRKARMTVRRDEEVPMGIASNIGHELSMIVKEVLQKWEFPFVEAVRWDPVSDDIEVNGWARKTNGKGVKAIFHSALKVAVLIYCRRKSLPHPGFIFLDSPLVTYRKPIMYEKQGELAADELAVSQTSLDRKFYEHLASISDLGQFIVIENADPPSGTEKLARIEVFSGQNGVYRQGLFPPL